MKDIYDIMNFCILWSLFISNILVLIDGTMSFRAVLIVETIFIPVMYILIYIIDKLIKGEDKE